MSAMQIIEPIIYVIDVKFVTHGRYMFVVYCMFRNWPFMILRLYYNSQTTVSNVKPL